MLRTFVIAAALALAASSASAQKLDAKGHCHDAKGKMTPMSVCQPAAPAAKGAPHCSKGKPCGNSCIAKDKVCHK